MGAQLLHNARPQEFMGAQILYVGWHLLFVSDHTLHMVAHMLYLGINVLCVPSQTCGNLHAFMGNHDIMYGFPHSCNGRPYYRLHDHDGLWMCNAYCVWAPRKNLEPHTFCWATTNCKWTSTRRDVGAYAMCVYNHTDARNTHNVGMGAYMYAHANMWARIMHAHARR